MKIKLKQNINLWKISYKENSIELNTMFNSGFIDDVNIVSEFFKNSNPNAIDILIESNQNTTPHIRIENDGFSKDGNKFIPKRKIIEVPICSEMQQDCYQYNAMDAPSEFKKLLLEEVGKNIDKIILDDKPKHVGEKWLVSKLNRIKVIDNGTENS